MGYWKPTALGVAFDHDLDERLVDHVHLGLAVAVGEILLHTADDGGLVAQVGRARPVERDVAERRLGAPARRRVDAEDEALDAVLGLLVGQAVGADERSQVGVEAAERLGARPFVLHDAEEVDHLVAQARQMLGGLGRDLARHAAQALLDELLERPAGAIAGEHRQVVQVDVGVAMGVGDLLVIDLRQPVVCGDGARSWTGSGRRRST